MSGEIGTRHFVKTWWVLAFTLGSIAGAAAVAIDGVSYTIWGIVGFGLPILLVVAILEWLNVRRARPRPARWRWRRPIRTQAIQPSFKASKAKLQPRRGQLRAIAGRKDAEPPSSKTS